jgi:hypothetical protein
MPGSYFFLFLKGSIHGAGGVPQMVQSLPSKCGALSSNPRAAKKKKKKRTIQLNAVSYGRPTVLTTEDIPSSQLQPYTR